MPFSGPSSYLPTIDDFIAHWTDVDAALAPGNLTLAGGYDLAALESDRDDLSDEITQLVAAINEQESARTSRDNSKTALRERMRQLGAYINGVLAGSHYVGRVPDLIPFGANEGRWIVVMRDHVDIWTDINASPPAGFTPPLVLNGPYTLANFVTDTTALETTFQALSNADNDVNRERDERDAIYLRVREQLVRYRAAVAGLFPANHPLVLSLPRLTPLPGHTPDAVVLSGVWNGETKLAELSWTASDDPDLDHYEVRRSPVLPYDTDVELAVAHVPAGTLEHATDAGLENPSDQTSFKVYVVLNTSNERGSNAVDIEYL